MTREEIDAIYDAQQNSDQVNNAGITRAEIDAVFDSYEQHKNTAKSQSSTKASISSLVIFYTPNNLYAVFLSTPLFIRDWIICALF